MYESIWLWSISQILLLANWLAAFSALASFALLYFIRVPREERLMIDQFGDDYRQFMSCTGKLFPRVGGKAKLDL